MPYLAPFLQPTVLFALMVIVVPLGSVAIYSFRKVRERQIQFQQDLRVREMEHQVKMKQLEIELEKARGRTSVGQAA